MPKEAYFDMTLLDQPPQYNHFLSEKISNKLDLLVKVTEINLEVKMGIFVKIRIQCLMYTCSNQLFRTTPYNFDIIFETNTSSLTFNSFSGILGV